MSDAAFLTVRWPAIPTRLQTLNWRLQSTQVAQHTASDIFALLCRPSNNNTLCGRSRGPQIVRGWNLEFIGDLWYMLAGEI